MKRTYKILATFLLAASVTAAGTSPALASYPYLGSHGVNFGSGNLYLAERDVSLEGPIRSLSFRRAYNSHSAASGVLGYGWSAGFSEKLIDNSDSITLVQDNSRHTRFVEDGQGGYVSRLGEVRRIVRTSNGFELVNADKSKRIFDSHGKLTQLVYGDGSTLTFTWSADLPVSISNDFGQTFSFTYASGRLATLSTPAGFYTYGYDGNSNLVSVTNPDGNTRTYLYKDSKDPHNLTGIVDETNLHIRTIVYDDEDRVISSAFAASRDAVSIEYSNGLQRVLTDAQGEKTTYQLEAKEGVLRVTSSVGPTCSSGCSGSSDSRSYTYNGRQQLATRISGIGMVTAYTHDSEGQRLTETQAQGTPLVRTVHTTWDAVLAKPLTKTASSVVSGKQKTTSSTYDSRGNPLTITVAGWHGNQAVFATNTYTYDSLGRLLSINGPRTDVNDTTTLTWYANTTAQGNNRGQLHTVSNALNQTTTYSNYNSHGKPGTVTGADGVVTTFVYNGRGAATSSSSGALATTYTRDDAGRIIALTLPGNRTLSLAYANGLLTSITDNMGNSIAYSYDVKGRKTGEKKYDPSQALTMALAQAYNEAGNLSSVTWPGLGTESYTYDQADNLTQILDPTGLQTTLGRDALNRITSVTEGGVTAGTYAYDRQDNITAVTDARGKVTTYIYDDLGNVRAIGSPDGGSAVFTYDVAGNMLSATNARNQTTTYIYDALNRPLSQSVPGAARGVLITYDQGFVGKISTIQEEHGQRGFTYNSRGQLISETRVLGSNTTTIRYGYNSATGELASTTYPSGKVLSSTRAANGDISALQFDGQPLVSTMRYLPFGPMKSATLGSVSLSQNYNQRYQATDIQAATFAHLYTRNAAGNVTAVDGITAPMAATLEERSVYGTANNRLISRDNGTTISYTYDADGNVVSDGTHTFAWDALNRLSQVKQGNAVTAAYAYDSQNRRISKTVGSTVTHYHYDSDNILIAETSATGTVLKEYLYLNGEPIALQNYGQNPGTYYYVNDHLGTPQQLITATGLVVWQAAYLPYGEAQVRIDLVENNLRFPGQYFDVESGLHYNWNRYYDAQTGRYISADPIGLQGGMNVYAYVGGNPVNWFDPEGLDMWTGAYNTLGGHYLSFGGSVSTGWVTNRSTGEKCYIEIWCFQIGAGLTAGMSTNAVVIINGPKCGKGLAGGSVGMGLDIPIGTASVGVTSQGAVDISVGKGPGVGSGAIYAHVCSTTVNKCFNPCGIE